MTEQNPRISLEVKVLALAQIPSLAYAMGSWCGRHLATEDLAELVQYLEDCQASIERIRAARDAELERLRSTQRTNSADLREDW